MSEMDDITRKARVDSILLDVTSDLDLANRVSSEFIDTIEGKLGDVPSHIMLEGANDILSCEHCVELMGQIMQCGTNRRSENNNGA